MRSTGTWAVTVVATALVIAGVSLIRHNRGSGANSPTARGTLAPDFTLPQLNGQPLRLSSYRGKVVLLDFWATWCVPCREEILHFVELQNKYGQSGVQIIGVSMDDTADPVRTFYQQLRMNYPVVMGNAGIGEDYGGVLGLPIAFILDRDGRIVVKHVGATEPEVIEKDVVALLPNR